MKKYKELFKLISIFAISILIYIGLFLLCIPRKLDILWCILLQILGLPLSVFFFVFFHELGHFVFGKISGYEFVSFKVGPFEWKKENEKIKFYVIPQNMLILGQCLMAPPKPKKKGQPKFYLYNAGGLIFSYILDIILILLVLLIPINYIKWFLLPIVLIGIFLSLNNSLYSEFGVNDVCNHVNVKKNPKYINSILFQLEMLSNVVKGKRYGAKCLYKGYYEEKLNHITVPVVQLMFYQAIEHDRLDEAKSLSIIMRKNYANMLFWMQKLAFYFELLWADLVIDKDMKLFRRDFTKINSKMKEVCLKEGTDVYFYYQIYNSIYNNNYEIRNLVENLLKEESLLSGERLSLEKKFNYLIDVLNFYVNNGCSFNTEVLKNEIL